MSSPLNINIDVEGDDLGNIVTAMTSYNPYDPSIIPYYQVTNYIYIQYQFLLQYFITKIKCLNLPMCIKEKIIEKFIKTGSVINRYDINANNSISSIQTTHVYKITAWIRNLETLFLAYYSTKCCCGHCHKKYPSHKYNKHFKKVFDEIEDVLKPYMNANQLYVTDTTIIYTALETFMMNKFGLQSP